METTLGHSPARTGDAANAANETTEANASARRDWLHSLLLGAAGPAAMGACLGLHSNVKGLMVMTLTMPLIIMLLGALTLPGLYIGSALLNQNLSIKDMGQIALKALDALGVMMLGLAPAVLFISLTNHSADESIILTTLAVGLGAVLGLRAFWTKYADHSESLLTLIPFGIWTITSVGLGWQLYISVLRAGGLL